MQFLFFIVHFILLFCLYCKGFAAQYAITANSTTDNASILNILDPSSPSVISTAGAGDDPRGIAVTPNGSYALIANNDSNSVSIINIIDPSSPSAVSTISVGTGPIDLAVTPNSQYAVVLNDTSDNVSVLNITDPASPSVIATISVGSSPLQQQAITVTPNGQYSIVRTREGGFPSNRSRITVLNIIDPANPTIQGSVVITDGGPNAGGGVAVTPDGLYCVATGSAQIRMVSLANPSAPSVVSTLEISGVTFISAAVSPNGQYAFATSGATDTLFIFDITNPLAVTTLGSVTIGGAPNDVAITLNGFYAVVTSLSSNSISVVNIIDPTSPSVIGAVAVGGSPSAVATFPLLLDLALSSDFNRTAFQKVLVNTLSWATPTLFFSPTTYLIGRTSNDGSPSQGFYVPIHEITTTNGLLTYQDAYQIGRQTRYSYTVTAIGTSTQTDEVATGTITTP